ncbi:hypothetical protein B0H10DRAFT_2215444 [Mycena sp. CBHHK59/15]|nr:hypothetical protein B0H10DRAFT_2215444 [Mycena sp. CBHHK59/15]
MLKNGAYEAVTLSIRVRCARRGLHHLCARHACRLCAYAHLPHPQGSALVPMPRLAVPLTIHLTRPASPSRSLAVYSAPPTLRQPLRAECIPARLVWQHAHQQSVLCEPSASNVCLWACLRVLAKRFGWQVVAMLRTAGHALLPGSCRRFAH